MTTLAIEPEDLVIVQQILDAYLPAGSLAYVFGSRANGSRHRRGSNLDLSIDAGSRLDGFVLAEMQDGFIQSMPPYAVNVHERHAADPQFLARIQPDLVAVPALAAGNVAVPALAAGNIAVPALAAGNEEPGFGRRSDEPSQRRPIRANAP